MCVSVLCDNILNILNVYFSDIFLFACHLFLYMCCPWVVHCQNSNSKITLLRCYILVTLHFYITQVRVRAYVCVCICLLLLCSSADMANKRVLFPAGFCSREIIRIGSLSTDWFEN